MLDTLKWVVVIRLDTDVMDVLQPYIRLIEDVPVTLWAVDELELDLAIRKIEDNLNAGTYKSTAECDIALCIANAMEDGGMSLKDYDIHLAMEPTFLALLKPRGHVHVIQS